jgi:hypothetical protein
MVRLLRIESPSSSIVVRSGWWQRVVLAVVFSVIAGICPLSARADEPAGNLVINGGMEIWSPPPYDDWYPDSNGVPLLVASDWQSFLRSGTEPRFMNDNDYAALFWDCCQAIDRHPEGYSSQNLWLGRNHDFSAGIYQQISVTVGTPYTAKAWDLSAVPSTDPDPDGKVLKMVGIDPYGGTDPNSPNIVWGEADGRNKHWPNVNDGVRSAARAAASTITLFVRVDSIAPPRKDDWNAAWIDAVTLFEAPTVHADSPEASASTRFTVRWDNAQAAPNGSLNGRYDVQYKRGINGVWTDWIDDESGTQSDFGPNVPDTYYFRARAYEIYSGIRLYGAFNPDPEGDTHTTVGNAVSGYIRGNTEFPISDAVVGLSGTISSTTTDSQGHYMLAVPTTGNYALTASQSNYGSPPPVPFSVTVDTPVVPITMTLRPPVEAVVNGDFENGLDHWTASGDPEIQQEVVRVRSGTKSLRLPDGSRIEQSFNVQGMYKPVLSFYARTNMGSAGDHLIVGRTQPDLSPLLTLTESNGGWTHYYVELGVGEVYTGPLGIFFQATQAGSNPMEVYLDEVSVGKSPGGPYKTYLPIILK